MKEQYRKLLAQATKEDVYKILDVHQGLAKAFIIDVAADILCHYNSFEGYSKPEVRRYCNWCEEWLKENEKHPQQQESQQAGNCEAKPTEAQESPLILPGGLHTDEAVKVYEAAIKAGYITKHGDCYKWNKSNALLAYMCGRLYCGDSIGTDPMTKDLKYKKGYRDFPEAAICTLFNVKNMSQSRRQLERPPKGYEGIDKLF